VLGLLSVLVVVVELCKGRCRYAKVKGGKEGARGEKELRENEERNR
jgi:hypothetical protein